MICARCTIVILHTSEKIVIFLTYTAQITGLRLNHVKTCTDHTGRTTSDHIVLTNPRTRMIAYDDKTPSIINTACHSK